MKTIGGRRLIAAGAVALLVGVGAGPLPAKTGSVSAGHLTPTDVSRSVAKKYVAALTAKSTKALRPLFARNAVELDKTAGETFHGVESITSTWNQAFTTAGVRIQGSVTCASPTWAVVSWTMRSPSALYAGGTMKVPGVSILDIRNGLITRETYYYERVDVR